MRKKKRKERIQPGVSHLDKTKLASIKLDEVNHKASRTLHGKESDERTEIKRGEVNNNENL